MSKSPVKNLHAETKKLIAQTRRSVELYEESYHNLCDTHEMSRFAESVASDAWALLKLACAWDAAAVDHPEDVGAAANTDDVNATASLLRLIDETK